MLFAWRRAAASVRSRTASVTAGGMLGLGLGVSSSGALSDGSDPYLNVASISAGVVGSMVGYAVGMHRRSRDPNESHDLSRELMSRGKASSVNAKHPGRVFTVVLTGGPCAGKTSSQEHLGKTLTAAGYDVYFAPEVPTIMLNGGCQYPGLAPEMASQLLAFEKSVILMQLQVEQSFLSVARSTGRPGVVVFDRGLLDIPAYLPRDTWLSILKDMGYAEQQFAERYDLVLHLVTTAHGLEHIYMKQKANNAARSEDAEQARNLDDKVLSCWACHPRVKRLGNDTTFEQKISACGEYVLEMIRSA